jgi:hypothetical protein
LHAPLRHLALFRGIGSDAYAVSCVWWMQREGAAPAAIDAALLARLYTRNCDYLMINTVLIQGITADLTGTAQATARTTKKQNSTPH